MAAAHVFQIALDACSEERIVINSAQLCCDAQTSGGHSDGAA